jgi:dihydroneopterin aldolase
MLVLRGLRVLSFCGALPEEQQRRQPFSIDVEVTFDMDAAAASDELSDTADYGAIVDALSQLARQERFALMERFAARLIESVLADGRVERVTVTVTKLRPPVPHDLGSAAVTMTRARPR